MSAYQYYEFLAIDRPLTERQLAEIRNVSTRAKLTPTSFVNEYNFGGFKGDPVKFLTKHYDLMVYYANWGTHRFMFSVPGEAIDPQQAGAYCVTDSAEMHAAGDKVIFDLTSQVEDWDWEEEGNWMVALAPVRDLVIGGDLRPLYLAWLSGVPDADLDEDDVEPPVPPGLGRLPAPLKRLAEFLRVDQDLLDVAAQGSAPLVEKDDRFDDWLISLPEAEKASLLTKLAAGTDPHAAAKLRRRFLQEQASRQSQNELSPRRPIGQLLREAEETRHVREERERRLAAEKRARSEARKAKERADYLDGLAEQEENIWKKVEGLVNEKNAKSYDQAVTFLIDLRDLADRSGHRSAFDQRVTDLHKRHQKKTTFIQRLRNVAPLQR